MVDKITRKELLIEYHLWEAINWRASIERVATTSSEPVSMSVLCNNISEKEPLSPSEVETLAGAAVQAGLLEDNGDQVRLTEISDTNNNHQKEVL